MHHGEVYRRGDVVIRDTGPWAGTVHALLRHLEDVGFGGTPRLVGAGFDERGRETLVYIEGEFLKSGPWSLEAANRLGRLLRELHTATASFRPPPNAVWGPWFGRTLGGPRRVIGHCDVAPWNIVVRDGLPVALIDWDFAGPVDPLVELAQACWLNVKLWSDDVAELEALPPLEDRARQLRAIVDAYGLPAKRRRGFVDRIIEFVAHAVAEEADDGGVTHDRATWQPEFVWAFAWRARSATWIYRNRGVLQNALT